MDKHQSILPLDFITCITAYMAVRLVQKKALGNGFLLFQESDEVPMIKEFDIDQESSMYYIHNELE